MKFCRRSTVATTALFLIAGTASWAQDDPDGAEDDIRRIIGLYTEGTYEGDSDKLNHSFHPDAVMNGYLGDQQILSTPAPFIKNMAAAPMKDSGVNYQSEIARIDIAGKTASATLKETGFPGDMVFTNFFHLINDDSGWRIISKTFFGTPVGD